MAEAPKRVQTTGRGEGKESTQTPGTGVMPPIPPISDEAREDLTNLMQDLLMKAHELSFEYSISECEKIRECAFASKAKELFKVVKRLYELTRKITPPEKIRAIT